MRHILTRNCFVDTKDYTAFATSVINLCAHYRTYFKYLGVHTKFFLISSFNLSNFNRSLVEGYNKTMVEKIQIKPLKEMIDLNLGLLDLICPYLPDIFFLKTEQEASVLMNHIMNMENSEIPSLIISTDVYPMQLAGIRENVCHLWPKRDIYGNNISVIICNKAHPEHKKSFWSAIAQKSWKSVSFDTICELETSNFALLGALSSLKERDIKVLYNISTAGKLISSVIGSKDMKLSPDILFDMIQDSSLDRELIQNRYKAIDINFQYMLYLESVEIKSIHYENLNDPDTIQSINDKYFKNNPIDIYRL